MTGGMPGGVVGLAFVGAADFRPWVTLDLAGATTTTRTRATAATLSVLLLHLGALDAAVPPAGASSTAQDGVGVAGVVVVDEEPCCLASVKVPAVT